MMCRDEMVQYLLSQNANVDIQSDSGITALIWATERNHMSTVSLLLKAGCKPDLYDKQGQTGMKRFSLLY
jgi:ankyrin repeat protein